MRFTQCVLSMAVAGVFVASPAFAQGRTRGTVRVGADCGGDKVIQFQYSDGSTATVVAGAGISAAVGGALELFNAGPHALDTQVNAGIKYRTIPPATNQTASWIRFPVEGLLMYRAPNGLRLGGGVTAHLANKMEASGEAAVVL